MAEVVVFHHALGLTGFVCDFAGRLREDEHVVHTPDLLAGRTFDRIEDGLAFSEELGGPTALVGRARVAVDALPAELAYVDKGLAPVLLAQPTYKWGYVSVEKIVEKVHLKQDVPPIIPMELVKVTKDNLGTWARQLKDWGFTDVPDSYLKLP